MNNKFSEITIVYIEDSDDVRFAGDAANLLI